MAGTSCQGHTASRRTADEDDANTNDWQAELLHNVDKDTFRKLDTMAADLDEMATRERWLFCRSCKAWHTVPCSKTSSKFLMLSILGLLLLTRPINAADMAADMQGKADYSIAESHGVAVYEYRYDAVLDASASIIVIEMPFLRLRAEMGKLRTAIEKASSKYDQERELYAGLQEELKRFEAMLSSTVDLFTVKDERKEKTLTEWLGGLLGLYNTVKVRQIETKEDSTREVLKTANIGTPECDGSPREGGGKIHWGGDRQTGGHKEIDVLGQQGQAGKEQLAQGEGTCAGLHQGRGHGSGAQGGPSAIQPG